MSCQCNRLLKSTSYQVLDDVFYINTNGTFTPTNRMGFTLVLCQTIPAQSSILPVSIVVNNVNYPLLDRFGNRVMITDLCTRVPYAIAFGANSPHFIAFNICSNLRNVNLAEAAEAALNGSGGTDGNS